MDAYVLLFAVGSEVASSDIGRLGKACEVEWSRAKRVGRRVCAAISMGCGSAKPLFGVVELSLSELEGCVGKGWRMEDGLQHMDHGYMNQVFLVSLDHIP